MALTGPARRSGRRAACRRLAAAFALVLVLAVLLVGCSGSDGAGPAEASEVGQRGTGSIAVVASTPIVGDWVAQVGGDRVGLTTLVRAGADVHTLQLRPSDIVALEAADLVVINGAGLEAGFRQLIEQNASAPLLVLADGLPLETLDGGARDPHFWLDAGLAIGAVEQIRDALIALDGGAAEAYRAAAARYSDEIRAVDQQVRALLDGLSPERRLLVTLHDAYGYFARRYGLEILGFLVQGPESEPTAEDLAVLVERMRRAGAGFIFQEPQFSARAVQQIADETGATIRTIYSQPSGEIERYLELLLANARAIAD